MRDQFENGFSLLKEFFKKNKRWPEKNEFYKRTNIGQWLRNKQRQKKEGVLKNVYIDELNSIGIPWDFSKEGKRQVRWEENFKLLNEYYMRYSKWPTQKEIYKGNRLGNWCNNQRTRKKCLSKNRITKLNSIGFQ